MIAFIVSFLFVALVFTERRKRQEEKDDNDGLNFEYKDSFI